MLSVTANPATISLGTLATHTITYSCQTSAGDVSSALLTIVVQDSSSPVVTLLGSSSVTITEGDVYGQAEDDGATASDLFDGDLTGSIARSRLPVGTSALGIQLVTYTVTESQNLSAPIRRTSAVFPDQLFFASRSVCTQAALAFVLAATTLRLLQKISTLRSSTSVDLPF